MKIKKFSIYLADLNPKLGTEPGKIRPVVVIQTNLLNNYHPSTIICPVTSKISADIKILRIRLNDKENNLKKESEILVDQVRAIDNKRFIKEIGTLSKRQRIELVGNLNIILFE
jgi:mRNA interferase MazF